MLFASGWQGPTTSPGGLSSACYTLVKLLSLGVANAGAFLLRPASESSAGEWKRSKHHVSV